MKPPRSLRRVAASPYRRVIPLLCAAIVAVAPAFAFAAEIANIKVVTDASPDYSDMESMVHSITSNWKTDAEKMWALFYWDHIGRRQTSPMYIHGYELTDPIRQYNDYGFAMCSTIAGMKCSTWNYMNYPCRFWEIGLHTVPDVWYDGRFHHYDNSLSVTYTLCDGKTIAAVDEIGKTIGCDASGGKEEPGHIAIYHSLNGTSVNGFLQGADTERTLEHLGAGSFRPKNIQYQWFYYSQDRGHRYILNLRDGESYTRYYSRQDAKSPNAIEIDTKNNKGYKADPAYYVPNPGEKGTGKRDPEVVNVRYHIRGNGERIYAPDLVPASCYSSENVGIDPPNTGQERARLRAIDASKPGVAVFKVQGANVITSLKIRAAITGKAAIAISSNNGIQWKNVWKSDKAEEAAADVKLIDEVNGSYEVLVKVTLQPGVVLKDLAFNTITALNSKTQPQLKLGKNIVYVGVGEQTESIVFWPDLQKGNYKLYAVDESNIKSDKLRLGHDIPAKDAYVTFKMDAPTDLTSVTYGGRLYNAAENGHIDFLHSFDGGKTWKQDYSLTDNKPPHDVIHYETITDIPAGTRSVLLKYVLSGFETSLYNVRMEANHRLPAQSQSFPARPPVPTEMPEPGLGTMTPPSPLEVTFTWQERQPDFSLVKRSHTKLVEKLPIRYEINVGGTDHPIVDSLAINLARQSPLPVPGIKYGYSDNSDVGGEKFLYTWATYGKNLALGKPYAYSVEPLPKDKAWGAEDPTGKKLTDGRVGSSYTGGINMSQGAMWRAPGTEKNPPTEITVDLGESQKCAAFRIHTCGYEWWDSLKNQSKDKIEVLVSEDNKDFTSVGQFKTNLLKKDIPINFMLPDDETLCGPNLFLAPENPVTARYVKYKITSPRMIDVTEVQVLDSYEFKPFDLNIALPDPTQNGKAPPKPDVSPNAKQWKENELPKNIIGVKP